MLEYVVLIGLGMSNRIKCLQRNLFVPIHWNFSSSDTNENLEIWNDSNTLTIPNSNTRMHEN